MGFISYRKRVNNWQIRYRKGDLETSRTLPGNLTERQVKKFIEEQKALWALGQLDPFLKAESTDYPIELDLLINHYLHLNYTSGKWTEKTHQTNKERLQLLWRFTGLAKPVALLTQKDFQAWIDSLKISPASKKSYCSTLNSFLNWLHRNKVIPERYRVHISIKDSKALSRKQLKYITEEQLYQVIDFHGRYIAQTQAKKHVANDFDTYHYIDMWLVYFYMLLRREELLRIKVKDISKDFRFCTIHGKGKYQDIIPIPESVQQIFVQYSTGKEPEQTLFGLKTSKYMYESFKRAVTALFPESKFNIHSLRHGGIVHLLSKGMDINFVSKFARHKTINITASVYGDIIPSALEDAIRSIGK